MNDNPEKKKKQLIVPENQTPNNNPQNELSLERLESLCYTFEWTRGRTVIFIT